MKENLRSIKDNQEVTGAQGNNRASVFFVCLLMISVYLQGGGFYVYVSAAAGIALAAALVIRIMRSGLVFFRRSLFFPVLALVCILHFAVTLWGVDPSLCLKGGVKFLPLTVFAFYLMQISKKEKDTILSLMPLISALMIIAAWIISHTLMFGDLVIIDGRLGGFFQYPNTFAVFSLACFVIAVSRITGMEKGTADKTFSRELILYGAAAAINLLGLLLSGSRTAYILAAGYLLWKAVRFLFIRDRKTPEFSAGGKRIWIAVAAAVCVIVLLAVTGAFGMVWRRFSLAAAGLSTLRGRLLYALDALGILRDHLFGLGYYGYRFIQGTYQTGSYSVVNVHNELLQTMLDVGVIPGLLLAAGVVRDLFFPAGGEKENKVFAGMKAAAVLILLHSLFDYDFQFLAMSMLFLLLVPLQGGKKIQAGRMLKGVTCTAGLLILAAVLTIGISDFRYVYHDYQGSEKTFPNTLSELNLLTDEITNEERDAITGKILKRTAYVSAAYASAAQACYGVGDVQSLTVYQKAAIRTAPYRYSLYSDYMEMLYSCHEAYLRRGNEEDAKKCAVFAREIPEMLNALKERTSTLGYSLNVKPVTELDEDSQKMLDAMSDN